MGVVLDVPFDWLQNAKETLAVMDAVDDSTHKAHMNSINEITQLAALTLAMESKDKALEALEQEVAALDSSVASLSSLVPAAATDMAKRITATTEKVQLMKDTILALSAKFAAKTS